MNIALFCSSSNELSEVFYTEAEKLGTFIGTNNHTLVYGGSANGLMQSVAKTAHENGAHIIGIIPAALEEKASDLADELMIVDSLSERKEMMKEYAEAFVVLPGGLGTLDEFFDVLASKQLEDIDKNIPVILVNCEGHYNALIEQMKHNTQNNFGQAKKFYSIADSTEECIRLLKELVQ